MWLLAIDTTAEFGSLALLQDGAVVVEEVPMHSADGFGHVVFGKIEELLDRHGLSTQDIGCFAAGAGPGSFTGVRVGMTAAKGLAEACGVPVVGVSNLEAIASYGASSSRAALLDARRGEVYGAVFGEFCQSEVVARFPEWLAQLPEGITEFVAQDFGPFAAAIEASRFGRVPKSHAPRALAASIGRIGQSHFLSGKALDPAALDANYVRRSDAEILWKELL